MIFIIKNVRGVINMNKAFTLVELIAVVVILGIILVIAVPQITDVINNAKVNAVIKNEEMLVRVTKNYLISNNEKMPTEIGSTEEVTLEQLQTEELIQPIKSPFINGNCNGYVLITKIDNNSYDYTPHLNCVDTERGSAESDGLILHYKFDDFQERTRNLFNDVTSVHGDYTRVIENGWHKLTSVNAASSMGLRSYVNLANLVDGETYTSSATVYNPMDKVVGIRQDWCDIRHTVTYVDPGEIKVISITDSRETYTSVHRFYDISLTSIGDTIWIKNQQIEQKHYATPFVDGIREGLVKDHSKNNHHATLNENTPRWIEDSLVGKGAYRFNGANNYMNVGESLLALKSNNTYSYWLKTNTSDTTGLIAHGDRVNEPSARYSHYLINGYLVIGVSGAFYSNISDIRSQDVINDGNWYYITVTFEASTKNLKLYINGIEESAETTVLTYFYSSANLLNFGRGQIYNGPEPEGLGFRYYNGVIDNISIYNRVLSPGEINMMYQLGRYRGK